MINEIKSFEERKDELLALGKKNGNKVTFDLHSTNSATTQYADGKFYMDKKNLNGKRPTMLGSELTRR